MLNLGNEREERAQMLYATTKASLMNTTYNILESYGIDPKPLFREMALDPELMKQPGARYRLDNIDNLWSIVSEVIDDPCH